MTDETQIGLNNDDANRVYRIVDKACAKHGCDAKQCSAIAEESAQEIHAAYERSTIGKANRIVSKNMLKGLGYFLLLIGGVVSGWLTGIFEGIGK